MSLCTAELLCAAELLSAAESLCVPVRSCATVRCCAVPEPLSYLLENGHEELQSEFWGLLLLQFLV